MSEPILLTDEQMREFIVNGYLMFEPTVPEGTHETCYRKLNEIIDSEANPGSPHLTTAARHPILARVSATLMMQQRRELERAGHSSLSNGAIVCRLLLR